MAFYQYSTNEDGLTITRVSGISPDETLLVPDRIDGKAVRSIGYAAFYCCSAKEIVVPEGILRIEGHAFAKCGRLRKLTLPGSLEYIGPLAFNGCMELLSLTIPEGVRRIDSEAFSWCRGLTELFFDCRDADIGPRAFYFCLGLKGPLLLKGVQHIENAAFAACMNLREVSFASEVRALGNFAFQDCYALEQIRFEAGSGLEELGDDVFSDCRSLRTVELPGSLRSVGIGTFRDCGRLTAAVLPGSIRTLPSRTFSNCASLMRSEVPEGIGRLDPFAFHKCPKLTAVRLAPSVKELADHAFTECSALRHLDLSGVRTIEPHAFSYCDTLETIEISPEVRGLGTGSFVHCGAMNGVWLHTAGADPGGGPLSLQESVFVPFEPAGLRWIKAKGNFPDSYDDIFIKLRRFSCKCRMALWRLTHDKGLSEESRSGYIAYLRRVSHRIMRAAVEEDDIQLIGRMGELGLILEQHCDDYIGAAGTAGARCTGYLINYRRSRFGHLQRERRYAL